MKMEQDTGNRIYQRARKIFPIFRSITGDGVRKTLGILNQDIWGGVKLEEHEVSSGTAVFDWTVPKEWRIEEAYIEDESGDRIIDAEDCNLHVLGYSIPIDEWFTLDELKRHVFTQPDQPDVIPYVTSYYKERFGMCMSQRQLDSLKPGRYHMVIKSELFDGSLTYADLLLKGETEEEILITSYICHPSMANNECSGPSLLIELINYLQGLSKRRYSYRFVLNPETIGSITYLSRNLDHLKKHVKAGVVLSCVGDDRAYSIVHSRTGDTLSDRSLSNILQYKKNFVEYSFLDRGSDERQYNAPGVDLPVVGFCRSKYQAYPEYHTSSDDMSLVSPAGFQGAYEAMTEWISLLEKNYRYRMTVLCEPQLGKRGLYPTVSQKGSYAEVKLMTDFIAYADGNYDLIGISEKIGVPAYNLIGVADKLLAYGLIQSVIGYDKE